MADVPMSIKPEREYLHEILKHIDSGEYAIPLFQRDFVWDKKQVLDLFDSISRGYPIGSILLWRPKIKDTSNTSSKTYNKLSKNIITRRTFENPELEYFILDGAQRLTTFYGCLYGKGDADDRFNVYYNLESGLFEYPSNRNRTEYLVPVADLYDTFKLLDLLQDILKKSQDGDKAIKYIKQAKQINAIFQGYQIGELLFENYSLDEAGTVFARINSKGTDISKVSMLQALFYKDDQELLFSDWVADIKAKLGRWGFDKLREEDILNCCYRYSKLNFYDHDLMEKVDKLDFINHLDEIEDDLMREAQFLNEECGVISASLLPYARQWVILAGAFKEKKHLSESEKSELKKWLYYTTVCQSFMNGSMSVVRANARRFDKFISGEETTAIDYSPIKLPELKFNFQLTSALSCLLMIALVNNFEKTSGRKAIYCGEYKALGGKNPAGVIPYFSDSASSQVYSLMNKRDYGYTFNLEEFGLSDDMMAAWNANDKNLFETLRKAYLLKLEKDMLETIGIEIEPSTND